MRYWKPSVPHNTGIRHVGRFAAHPPQPIRCQLFSRRFLSVTSWGASPQRLPVGALSFPRCARVAFFAGTHFIVHLYECQERILDSGAYLRHRSARQNMKLPRVRSSRGAPGGPGDCGRGGGSTFCIFPGEGSTSSFCSGSHKERIPRHRRTATWFSLTPRFLVPFRLLSFPLVFETPPRSITLLMMIKIPLRLFQRAAITRCDAATFLRPPGKILSMFRAGALINFNRITSFSDGSAVYTFSREKYKGPSLRKSRKRREKLHERGKRRIRVFVFLLFSCSLTTSFCVRYGVIRKVAATGPA